MRIMKNSDLENKKVIQSLKAKNKTSKIQSKNKKKPVQKLDKVVKEKRGEMSAQDLVTVVNAGEAKNSSKQKDKKKNTNEVKKTQLKPIVDEPSKGSETKEETTQKDLTKKILGKVINAGEIKKSIKQKGKKKKLNEVEKVQLKATDQEVASNGTETKIELTDKDLAKIAKKKAKKISQKLLKQNKKKEDLKEAIISKKKTTEKDVKTNEKKTKQNQNLAPAKEQSANESKKINPKKQRKVEKKNLSKKLKDDDEEASKRATVDFEVATVFVGNLPVNTKRVQLVRLFEKYGPVGAIRIRTAGGKIIMKHKQRKEAGSLNAYVVLKDAVTAEKALELNGTEFKTNHLRVTRVSKNAHNAGNADAKNMVFVGNLKYSATEEKLREIFSSCGEIEYVRCLHNGEKGCNGVAYVCFKTADSVGLALELNETILDERPIRVERYSVKKLGAKEARDKLQKTSAQGTKKAVTGAKKRLDNKKKKQSGKTSTTPQDRNDKKKTEFRGVKVNDIKKKQKKKKPSSQLKQMAKKIAPKPKESLN